MQVDLCDQPMVVAIKGANVLDSIGLIISFGSAVKKSSRPQPP